MFVWTSPVESAKISNFKFRTQPLDKCPIPSKETEFFFDQYVFYSQSPHPYKETAHTHGRSTNGRALGHLHAECPNTGCLPSNLQI